MTNETSPPPPENENIPPAETKQERERRINRIENIRNVSIPLIGLVAIIAVVASQSKGLNIGGFTLFESREERLSREANELTPQVYGLKNDTQNTTRTLRLSQNYLFYQVLNEAAWPANGLVDENQLGDYLTRFTADANPAEIGKQAASKLPGFRKKAMELRNELTEQDKINDNRFTVLLFELDQVLRELELSPIPSIHAQVMQNIRSAKGFRAGQISSEALMNPTGVEEYQAMLYALGARNSPYHPDKVAEQAKGLDWPGYIGVALLLVAGIAAIKGVGAGAKPKK
jgi:hypothetical protein